VILNLAINNNVIPGRAEDANPESRDSPDVQLHI
jgi:hypothetical protein